MAKGANTTRIGAFVLVGILLVVAAISIFGSGRLFRESRQFSMNFSASMQGLSRGSPVMFSGVPVGEVTDIILRLDGTTLEYDSGVLVNIYPDRFETKNEFGRTGKELMPDLIDRGLRARLVPISILTGQLGIELGFYPGTAVRLSGSKSGVPEIPTIPSTVERMETTLQKILAVLEGADMEGLSQNVEAALKSVSALMTMPELRETIIDGHDSLRDLRQVLAQVKSETPELLAGLRGTVRGAQGLVGDAQKTVPTLRSDLERLGPALAKLDTLLTSADTLMRNANATVNPDSPMQQQLAVTLRDLARTSASVRSLVTALEDNPNSILFGAIKGTNQ